MHSARFVRSTPLSTRIEWHGGRAILSVEGELDLGTLPIAQRALDEMQAAGAQRVDIDLRGVGFFDLSGVRLLFEADERWGTSLKVVGASEIVEGLLEFTGARRRLAHGRPAESTRPRFPRRA